MSIWSGPALARHVGFVCVLRSVFSFDGGLVGRVVGSLHKALNVGIGRVQVLLHRQGCDSRWRGGIRWGDCAKYGL